MKFVIYRCDKCDKPVNFDEVKFVNYKDIHYELCINCFDKYKSDRKEVKQ